MLCKEIIEKIEETYSPNYAMEWDLSLIHI